MGHTAKRVTAAIISVILLLGACACAETEAELVAQAVIGVDTDETQITTPFTSVITQVQNSVVGINNYQSYTYNNYGSYYGFGGRGGFGSRDDYRDSIEQLDSTGSGVVIYKELVVTNFHVVEDATRLTVSTLSGEEYEGILMSSNKAADIAVVYVPGLEIAPVPLGDSDKLQVGEWAICIGNPLTEELAGTVTLGIISALDRQINSTATIDRYGLKTTYTNSMIQTNAAINSGNSGGGLFNVLGQLQGIPSMKYTGTNYSGTTVEGIGLAIPINEAKPIIKEAIIKLLTDNPGGQDAPTGDPSGANVQQVSDKPLLGVTIGAINANNYYAVYMGVLPAGVKVDEVNEGSPAQQAGIQLYDIIVEADGAIITTTSQLKEILAAKNFGDTIAIKVYRAEGLADAQYVSDIGSGEYIDLTITLFEYAPPTA